MFENKKLLIFVSFLICLLKETNGITTTTSTSTTTGPYQLPNSSYSACGPYSFAIVMAIFFVLLITFHTLIVGAVIKRFLQSKKKPDF